MSVDRPISVARDRRGRSRYRGAVANVLAAVPSPFGWLSFDDETLEIGSRLLFVLKRSRTYTRGEVAEVRVSGGCLGTAVTPVPTSGRRIALPTFVTVGRGPAILAELRRRGWPA